MILRFTIAYLVFSCIISDYLDTVKLICGGNIVYLYLKVLPRLKEAF